MIALIDFRLKLSKFAPFYIQFPHSRSKSVWVDGEQFSCTTFSLNPTIRFFQHELDVTPHGFINGQVSG